MKKQKIQKSMTYKLIRLLAIVIIAANLLTLIINYSPTPYMSSKAALITKIIITALAVFPRGLPWLAALTVSPAKLAYILTLLWTLLTILCAVGIFFFNNKGRIGFVLLNGFHLLLFTSSWIAVYQNSSMTSASIIRGIIWLISVLYILYFTTPKVKKEFLKED